MIATYISNNSFSVVGDRTAELSVNRRLKLDCGSDGIKYATIISSVYTTLTTITIDETTLTSNLATVLYGIVSSGDLGSLPDHTHLDSDGDGGVLDWVTAYVDTVSGSLTSYIDTIFGSLTFIDLQDTPSSYGASGTYLTSTASGITFSPEKILYGTGDPPTPSGLAEGSIFIKYTI